MRPTFDIAPFAQTGESSQTDVVESSGGKMFLTKGTKKQTRCVFLVFFRSESGKIAALMKKLPFYAPLLNDFRIFAPELAEEQKGC